MKQTAPRGGLDNVPVHLEIFTMLDKLINLLTPFSEVYGTGNSHVDLLIIFAGLSLLCMFSVVLLLARNRNKNKNKMLLQSDRKTDSLSPEAANGASELKLYVDDLAREIHIMLDSLRSDTGFIRQEMYLMKRLLEDTKRDIYKQQSGDRKPNLSSPAFDTSPIANTGGLYTYEDAL